jgi:SAM-dependent methyltransferase
VVKQDWKQLIKRYVPLAVPLVRRVRPLVQGERYQYRAAPAATTPAAPAGPIDEIFSRIYDSNYWGNADSRSGSGSDLQQTAAIRAALPPLLRELGVRRMLDVPCGDFHWMSQCALELDQYIGADIVPELVAALGERFGDERCEFRPLDLTRDPLPQVDLVFSRDCLVHLSFADVERALANLKRSGSTWLLTTTFPDRRENIDIPTGHWRPLNLELAPFDFPPPERLINEGCTEYFNQFADKSLGLWRIAAL